MKTIRVLTGGPYHPVAAQADRFQEWLGGAVRIDKRDGVAAFEELDGCDLFVAAGLHWTGCAPDRHAWPEGVAPHGYTPMSAAHREAWRGYVASGRPVLGFHGGIASYDDTPEFSRLLGWRWDWRMTAHSRFARWPVTVLKTGHPVVEGVEDYSLMDELYFNIQIAEGLPFAVHARATGLDHNHPMVMTAEGGRVAGAGKTAYLANGHDLQALDCGAFRRIVENTVRWLLS